MAKTRILLRCYSQQAGQRDAVAQRVGAGAWQVTVRRLLELESGDSTAARDTLQSVILLPDRNPAHHYSRFIQGWKP